MAIVRDYYNGPTHIMVDDRYCRDKTPEEIKAIYKKVAEDAYPVLLNQYLQKLKNNQNTKQPEDEEDKNKVY